MNPGDHRARGPPTHFGTFGRDWTTFRYFSLYPPHVKKRLKMVLRVPKVPTRTTGMRVRVSRDFNTLTGHARGCDFTSGAAGSSPTARGACAK